MRGNWVISGYFKGEGGKVMDDDQNSVTAGPRGPLSITREIVRCDFSASAIAFSLASTLVPQVIIRPTPASAARAITASRSLLNSSPSKWACVSIIEIFEEFNCFFSVKS